MRGGEFKTVREGLSLTTKVMAELLGVSEGTVKAWERAKYRVPAGVAVEVRRLEEYTRRCVDAVFAAVEEAPVPAVVVYRRAEEMPPGPARTLGPAWWRSVAWRVRERAPVVVVGYAGEIDGLSGSRDLTLGCAVGAGAATPIK